MLTPPLSSSTTRHPRTAHQKSATGRVSTASIAITAMRLDMVVSLVRHGQLRQDLVVHQLIGG